MSTKQQKKEYTVNERELAEFMAFLSNSALSFDPTEDKYTLVDKIDINRQIKNAYEKGDYLKANTILKTAKKSSPTEVEKMCREINIRSLPPFLEVLHVYVLLLTPLPSIG